MNGTDVSGRSDLIRDTSKSIHLRIEERFLRICVHFRSWTTNVFVWHKRIDSHLNWLRYRVKKSCQRTFFLHSIIQLRLSKIHLDEVTHLSLQHNHSRYIDIMIHFCDVRCLHVHDFVNLVPLRSEDLICFFLRNGNEVLQLRTHFRNQNTTLLWIKIFISSGLKLIDIINGFCRSFSLLFHQSIIRHSLLKFTQFSRALNFLRSL